MPMYEKGSVRAGPRSKQQERMKKIMKKFLSLLLAMTMILSLVIVPARASGETMTGTLAVQADKKKVYQGDTVTFSLKTENLKVSVPSESRSATSYDATVESVSWSVTGGTAAEDEDATASTYTVTAGRTKIEANCTVTLAYTVDGTKQTLSGQTATKLELTPTEFSGSDVTEVTVNGRKYTVSSGAVSIDKFSGETITEGSFTAVKVASPFTAGSVTVYSTSGGTNTATVEAKYGSNTVSTTINVTENSVSSPNVTVKADNKTISDNTVNAVTEQTVELTADYTNKASGNAKYQWTLDGSNATTGTSYSFKATTAGDYKVKCTVSEGTASNVAESAEITIKVARDHFIGKASGNEVSKKLATGETWDIATPYIYDTSAKQSYTVSSSDVTWKSSNEKIATVSPSGVVTAGEKSGVATITATITYNTKPYKVEYEVTVKALDVELDSIANGDYDSYDRDEFARILADKIDDVTSGTSFKYSDVRTVELVSTTTDDYLKFTKDTSSSSSAITDLYQDFRINATKGYLGDQTFKVRVNGTYTVVLTVNVEGAGSAIKDTVNGTAANKDVTFTNSDYKYLYYTTSKVTDYEGYFNGKDVRGWSEADKNKTVTVKASEFSNNKTVTLYVVGVDSDGYASTGTITVSQKSYDINYNVVAGKSVTFSQKDFESFLEDYAEDNGNYNPKKDEITFDHATLNSLPTAKSEGTLYYGGSEVTSTSNRKAEYTDMDKMTFEAVAKPTKDTVTLTFRVYGEIEKPNSRKPDKVDYYVNVVISVVKEDITYTVGIDDTVQLTARDFVNFLQDAKTSYRKSTLDYVKFDVSGKNVSSYAYGGLYRSYSSYSTGKLADSTDKFYYEPSRTQYDLADVAYHTTRWAEAGKTVYIPFTVYGTKNEEASGTMAITIAQTMNFIDVKASDFFYEPVKWAVNNKITNGTSSTTFSPYKNCNRAEIVTFLWRAAGSPEPTVTRNPFTDVNSVRDASYYKAILWASQKGITAGTNATTFSPYQECTRSQIVTFLYRYAGKPSGNYTNPFKDVSSVNEASYYNAILWAVGKGITQGTSTTTFSPYASCTRGEAVTFLYRYVNGVK